MEVFRVRIEGRFIRVVEAQGNTAAEAIAAAKTAYKDRKNILGPECVTRMEFSIDDSANDEAGVCPLCGGSVEYGERESMDEGGVYFWTCPSCGATGREGYNEIFDGHHYNVRDKNGDPVPGRSD